ncbi:hypothetical protein [Corallococcus exiguus]|uniref:hypothetical protein n=1 Tax=Corallococcus exiguus TaxID=83462 RepID=UPI00155FAB9A|nr:hypothetical protein [Corallococcus exiguus]NRD51516.1 hypothetical protein [Corallococcus exiguus]
MAFPAYERRDARGLFLIRTGGDLLWRMRTTKMMLVQYQSIDGKQVLRYSLDGFRPKLDKLCSKYRTYSGPR